MLPQESGPTASALGCSRPGCDRAPVVDQPYAGRHLCAPHFRDSVLERARRELHRQAPRLKGGTLAVALSGGKDSAAALWLCQKLLGARHHLKVVAISVDEGIAGYRAGGLARAKELCDRLDVEHVVRSLAEEVGQTTDRAAARLPQEIPCSFCGVWRRKALNRAALEMGAVRLALGFNLDDLAQTVLMNLARGEPDRLAQMAPHARTQPGLVPRVAPLASVPEREVYLFARLQGLPFDHATCPHAGRAGRNVFREVLWQLEEAVPGTRHALLRTREKLLLRWAETAGDPEALGAPGACRSCGEPAAGERCRACAYLEMLSELPPQSLISASGSGRP